MRYLLPLAAAAFPALVMAQVTQQSASVSSEGEKRVVRQVILKDEHGMDVLVEQHLIELENGDYLYLHSSQPRATRELDERICASFGSRVSRGSVIRLSPDTLGGGACRSESPEDPSSAAPQENRAPYLQAVAPGNYVVSANQNSVRYKFFQRLLISEADGHSEISGSSRLRSRRAADWPLDVVPAEPERLSARPPDFTRVSAPTCGRINSPEPGRPSRRVALVLPSLSVSIAHPRKACGQKRKGA